MKKFFVFLTILVLTISMPFSIEAEEETRNWDNACTGSGIAEDVATIQGFQCILANLLNVVMTAFSFIGFIMFVYGSLTWLLAGGQSNKVEQAKSTFTNAVFGLILAVSSFIIIQIVTYFTGINHFLKLKFLDQELPPSSTTSQIVNRQILS